MDIHRNVEQLGQIFTPQKIVGKMNHLRRNHGTALEPSAGEGDFLSLLEPSACIELDKELCPDDCLCMDFFDYSIENKFVTIMGNPPYVAFKNIQEGTKNKLRFDLFDKRANLYLFFIEKCFRHLEAQGEIIFITPRDFIKATSSFKLNQLLWDQGTITHFFDLGDKQIFKGFSPTCAVWRYEKDNLTRKTITTKGERNFVCMNGQICFTKKDYSLDFKDLFFVKVGAVSGLDEVFEHPDGNEEFVCSYTRTTNKLKRMYYNVENDYLMQHKDRLLNRRVKKFKEADWWKWGRECHKSDEPRIYVNCKTRAKNPFFLHPCKNYDGSILAIFPTIPMRLEMMRDKLNQIDWEELGFKTGGRYVFTQKTLENVKLPANFNETEMSD